MRHIAIDQQYEVAELLYLKWKPGGETNEIVENPLQVIVNIVSDL